MSQIHSSDDQGRVPHTPAGSGAGVTLGARPERRLIRHSGSLRHVDFHLRVAGRAPPPAGAGAERPALHLALVLDRSGSMAGRKLETARRAALAVLDRLDERDRVAVVVFDNQIDVLQPAAPATAALKARRAGGAGRRAGPRQHGPARGLADRCHAIAADDRPRGRRTRARAAVARCFLLTDGLANVGLTDPEQIATEAAGIREHAGRRHQHLRHRRGLRRGPAGAPGRRRRRPVPPPAHGGGDRPHLRRRARRAARRGRRPGGAGARARPRGDGRGGQRLLDARRDPAGRPGGAAGRWPSATSWRARSATSSSASPSPRPPWAGSELPGARPRALDGRRDRAGHPLGGAGLRLRRPRRLRRRGPGPGGDALGGPGPRRPGPPGGHRSTASGATWPAPATSCAGWPGAWPPTPPATATWRTL